MRKKGFRKLAAAAAVAVALSVSMTSFAAETPAAKPQTEAAQAQTPALANEWTELLYGYLLKDNYQAVMQHVGNVANVQAVCAGYEYAGWARDTEIAYRLMANDGKIFWIAVSRPGAGEVAVPFLYVVFSKQANGRDSFWNVKEGYRYVWMTEDQTEYASLIHI